MTCTPAHTTRQKVFRGLISGILTVIITGTGIHAQNLESIGKEKPFRLNGGVSVNQTSYASSDSLSGRDPYNFYLTGNLNLNLYGWSVPLSFNYSNQKTTFTQPFNNYSLHPHYKWIRAHIGYTSMSFSPYSLNGHLFLGAGVELTPEGRFSFSAMAGRLKKSSVYDTLTGNPIPPVFERWGYGFKMGYKFNPAPDANVNLSINAFHAKDKPGSIDFIPDSSVYPGENLVLGVNTDISFGGHYVITAEVSSSAVNKNSLSDLKTGRLRSWNKVMGNFIGSNGTTEFYAAYRVNAGYNTDNYSIGIGYERIDPGYETFGAYYFNNDMQNITLNGNLQLLDDKISLSGNIGRQNDNLDNSKSGKLQRWVTAFNLSYSPDEKFNGALSYSSFTSFMNIRSQFVNINELTPYDNLDTLNFTQLSSTTTTSLSYIIRNTDRVRQNAAFNLSYQRSSEEQNGIDSLGASKFYNISSMYGYTLVPESFTATISFNTSFSIMPELRNTTLGPSLSLNKLWLDKKLRSTLSVAYNRSYNNGEAMNRIVSIRAGSGYRIGKRQNLSLNLTFMNRRKIDRDKRSTREFIGTFMYSLNF